MLQTVAVTPTTPPRGAADSVRSELRRDGVSMSGFSGLVDIPTAATLPSGMVELSYNTARNPESFPHGGWQPNAFVTFGFLPRVTISLRGTVAYRATGGRQSRDLSNNVQVALLRERSLMPALSVGGFDAKSSGVATFFHSLYVVSSKSLGSRVVLTAGFASGPKIVTGAFGGAEVRLKPWAAALGDFDGRRVGVGLRFDPFPAVADRIGVQPRVDLAWRPGVGTAIGVGLRTAMGGWPHLSSERSVPQPENAKRSTGATQSPGPTPPPDVWTGADVVQTALIDEGFENVGVSTEPGAGDTTIVVDYENRRYNRDELDALGVVLAVTSRYQPASVTRMQVTIRRVDLSVITVACSVRDFANFIDGRMSLEAFANALEISSPPPRIGNTGGARVAAKSRWKLDVVPQPLVKTALLNEIGVYQARYSLLADGWMQLAPGLVLNAQHTIAEHQDPSFPGWLFNSNSDRLLLHAAVPVTTPTPWGGIPAITQLTVGRFNSYQVGVADETNVTLPGGWLSLDGTLGVLGPSTLHLTSVIALAGATVRYAPLDLTATLTAGRFRDGDSGATAELARWFGSSKLGLYVDVTEFGRFAGVQFSLPLTPTRELAPSLIRPRLPDLYSQHLQASIEHGNSTARTYVAQLLDTDHDIARAYLDRDRLNAATMRRHVETIRATALAWMKRRGLR